MASMPTTPQPVSPPSRAATLPPRIEEPRVSPEPTVVTNAADFYRKAFAIYDALSKDEKEALGDWKAAIDADRAAQLCEKIRPICNLMHQAAALTNCDWGMGPLTPDTLLPHLAPSRWLARTATWSAAHCRADDADGAADDVLATLQIGHNISQSALIGFLVETDIQALAQDFIAKNASVFEGPQSERLIQALNDVQYEESFYRAIEQEADATSSKAKQGTSTGVGDSAMIRQVAELERELASVLTQPEAEYQMWLGRVQAAQETNPLLEDFGPAMEHLVDKARAMLVQRAMVSAGLTVLQLGPDALSTYPDPATGQPFQYQETADGFQLQSAYQRNGQPVTMVFRR